MHLWHKAGLTRTSKELGLLFSHCPPRKPQLQTKSPAPFKPSYRRASTTPCTDCCDSYCLVTSLCHRHLYLSTDRCQRFSTRLDSLIPASFVSHHPVTRSPFLTVVFPSFGLLPSRQPTTPDFRHNDGPSRILVVQHQPAHHLQHRRRCQWPPGDSRQCPSSPFFYPHLLTNVHRHLTD